MVQFFIFVPKIEENDNEKKTNQLDSIRPHSLNFRHYSQILLDQPSKSIIAVINLEYFVIM